MRLCSRMGAGVVFQDGHGPGGGLAIGAEEGDTVTVACGVNADADAVQRSGGGGTHEGTPESRAKEADRKCRADGVGSWRRRERPPVELWRGNPCDKRSGPHDVPTP